MAALTATAIAATATTSAQAAGTLTMYDPGLTGDLVPAVDGTVWIEGGHGAVRLAADGQLVPVESPPSDWRGSPVTLADGGIGYLAPPESDGPRRAWAAVRLEAGAPVLVRPLPAALPASAGRERILLPDGAVWFLDTCRDGLARVATDGRLKRFRLRAVGCGHVDEWDDPAAAQVLRPGVDGSTWIVNQCQGRVVRVGRDDRVREWRVRSLCAESSRLAVQPSRVIVEASGGLRMPGQRISAAGAIRPALPVVPDLVTRDGSGWTLSESGDAIVQTRPGAPERQLTIRDLIGEAYASEMTLGPDGNVWFVAGPWQRPPDGGWAQGRTTVASLAADGTARSLVLPNWPDGRSPLLAPPRIVAGADGALWSMQSGRVDDWGSTDLQRVARIVPEGPVQAGTDLRVVRTLGRSGARLWVQVACAAAPGRWCTGTARLADARGRSLLRSAPRVAVPADTRAGLLLPLTPAARRALRRGPIRARLTLEGATDAPQTITVPRRAGATKRGTSR